MIKTKNVFLNLNRQQIDLNYNVNDFEKLILHFLDISKLNSKINIIIKLKKNSEVNVILSSFLKKKIKKIFTIRFEHTKNNAKSSFKSYLIASAQSDVIVKVCSDIKPDTTNNKTAQEIKGVLLSNNASIHGEPQLIIDNNNVKATHAMAIGRINPNQIFYLMSRGIKYSTAMQLILMGYFNTTLSIIKNEKQKENYITKIKKLFKEI